eukprot:1538452-Prymnesium_polylepis.1
MTVSAPPASRETWRRPAPPAPRYYLHGSGALDFRREISTFLQVTTEQFDEARQPRYWQHAVDAFAVQR